MHTHNRLLTILAMPLLLAACAKSPESTVEGFYRAVAKGEISEAKGFLSKGITDALGPEKLSAVLANETQQVQSCGGLKDVTVKLGEGGEVRFGTVEITYGGKCPVRRENLKLVKEDGRWKLAAQK
jgi:hypothetical protein